MIDTVTLYVEGRKNAGFDINEKEFKKKQNEQDKTNLLYNTFYEDKERRNKSIYICNNLDLNFALVDFSVPKLLYGNSLENVRIEDTEKIEGILKNRLNGIFDTDFLNTKVSRLDITQNMEMENDIPIYIHSLKEAYSGNKRYRVEKYSDESLTIKNNSRRIVIYDKIKEAFDNKDITRQEAKAYSNILRYEIQHKKARNIKTSFNNKKQFVLTDVFTMEFFETAKLFQLKMFDEMFCNSGNYGLFMSDIALMDIVTKYNKRGTLKNFVIKKLTDLYEHEHNFEHYEDLLKLSGMSRDGIRKAKRELRKLLLLSKGKMTDVIEEIRNKLVA